MMKIQLNGDTKALGGQQTIADLLTEQGYAGKLVAVAINGSFVPKSQHENHTVQDGDEIEIVAPMQGG